MINKILSWLVIGSMVFTFVSAFYLYFKFKLTYKVPKIIKKKVSFKNV
jgi:hypothetical protein